MKNKKFGIVAAMFFFFCSFAEAQSDHKLRREGDKDYLVEEYSAAELAYRKSLEKEAKAETEYNLGNTIYKQDRYDEAVEKYKTAIQGLEDKSQLADAYFNLGSAQLQNQEFQESAESFVQSLQIDPDDPEAKTLLLEALKQMKIQQQQQEQQQQEQQEQEQQEEQQQDQQQQVQENKDQQNQPQESEKEESSEEQQEGESEEDSEGSEESDEESKEDISRKKALEILKTVEDQEKKVHEKLNRQDDKKKVQKDW